jgi:hypothetical protein
MSRMPAVPAIAITSNPLPGDDRIGAPFARWNSHDLAGHVGQQSLRQGSTKQDQNRHPVVLLIASFHWHSVSRASLEANGHSRDRNDREFHATLLRSRISMFSPLPWRRSKTIFSVFFSAISTGVILKQCRQLCRSAHPTRRDRLKCALAKASGYLTVLNHSRTGARRGMFHAKRDLAFHLLVNHADFNFGSQPRTGGCRLTLDGSRVELPVANGAFHCFVQERRGFVAS